MNFALSVSAGCEAPGDARLYRLDGEYLADARSLAEPAAILAGSAVVVLTVVLF